MKTETGMPARHPGGLRRFLSNPAGWLVLILTLFPLSAAGFLGEDYFPDFQADAIWKLCYTARQPDGGWSAPKTLEFKTVSASEDSVFIDISFPENTPAARLELGRDPGYLRAVDLFQWIRGKQRIKRESFDGPAPVFPVFSVIPYFVPVFTQKSNVSEYQLDREISGVFMTSETLVQRIEPVDRQTLLEAVPAGIPLEWFSLVPDIAGIRVAVEKEGTPIFTQYWFPGLPWAVYMESENLRAWMVE